VGHSFSGVIVTEAGMHPNVSALVYVAARARCGRGLHSTAASILIARPTHSSASFTTVTRLISMARA
jgi:hypothetical protein